MRFNRTNGRSVTNAELVAGDDRDVPEHLLEKTLRCFTIKSNSVMKLCLVAFMIVDTSAY